MGNLAPFLVRYFDCRVICFLVLGCFYLLFLLLPWNVGKRWWNGVCPKIFWHLCEATEAWVELQKRLSWVNLGSLQRGAVPEHPGPPGLAALHQGLACRVWQAAALPYTGMNPFFRGGKKGVRRESHRRDRARWGSPPHLCGGDPGVILHDILAHPQQEAAVALSQIRSPRARRQSSAWPGCCVPTVWSLAESKVMLRCLGAFLLNRAVQIILEPLKKARKKLPIGSPEVRWWLPGKK